MKLRETIQKKEVDFLINNIQISGTLTIPKNECKQGIVFLSGYGPVTRDNEVKGLKRYKILAQMFAENNITSLRFDDRGCGKSTDVNWHDYTFNDLAKEAIAAANFLRNHPEITTDKIGFFGHSLGAIIGPLAATMNDDIAFIISAAPPGLNGQETALQTRNFIAKQKRRNRKGEKKSKQCI
ncbi:MAG: alpha/beta hydrolase [Asgard group archaeon]|nr:alpha/beta hydrolase [Asgard group archaeon]